MAQISSPKNSVLVFGRTLVESDRDLRLPMLFEADTANATQRLAARTIAHNHLPPGLPKFLTSSHRGNFGVCSSSFSPEEEMALVAGNRQLIERFEKKTQAVLARVWGMKRLVRRSRLGDKSLLLSGVFYCSSRSPKELNFLNRWLEYGHLEKRQYSVPQNHEPNFVAVFLWKGPKGLHFCLMNHCRVWPSGEKAILITL